MKKILLVLFISTGLFTYAQEKSFSKITDLPKELTEISGIETLKGSSLIWGINDSGNDAIVYGFTSAGKIKKEVCVENATNIDWEDVAKDANGTLYIADTGNNRNTRKDLSIYCIPDFLAQGSEAKAQKIEFTFADQTDFPPEDDNYNFGSEAMIYKDGFLYLFTKNRSKELDGTLNVYQLPAKSGKYTAKKIGSYQACNQQECEWITAACINQQGDEVLLLGKTYIWKLSDFSGNAFFEGKIQTYAIPGEETQKESLCYQNENSVYLADEKEGKKKGRKLYECSLK